MTIRKLLLLEQLMTVRKIIIIRINIIISLIFRDAQACIIHKI